MKLLGITGSSGSGKSSVCKIIKKIYNTEIIDADKIVKELQDNKTIYYDKIVEMFGQEILLDNGFINRKMLAEKIFTDKIAKEKLDKLTFKYVIDEIKNRIETLRKANLSYIIVDAPTLIEANMIEMFDKIIAVTAEEDIKLNRICKRDEISKEQAIMRLSAQHENSFYEMYADFVILNNDENLENKVKIILEQIERENS